MAAWLLLIYKIPREPTASRVYVWRKLKRLGALALQDAIWVLPATPWTREQFQWLAVEITELEGESTLWEATMLPPGHEASLIRQFTANVEQEYHAILTALQQPDPDLSVLARRYQQIGRQDHFQSALGPQVHAALRRAREGAPL
jgi:hypothetical protein